MKRFLISQDATLKQAFEQLNSTASGILLLVDQSDKFLRTVTDGDLRRLLLTGANLTSTLYELSEHTSTTVDASKNSADIYALMISKGVRAIPQLDQNGIPVELHQRDEFEKPILLSIPHMSEHESKYVKDAFDSNWVAPLGPNVDGFEQEIADRTQSGHAAALASGTAAIHLALVVLGVERDDIVFCSSLTFVASVNPVLYQGATPVFIDSAPGSWNMCPRALEQALSKAKTRGQLPKAIVVVNLYGYSADYDALTGVAGKYGVPIVEDAAESLGSTYHGRPSGSFGDIGIFSFNGNKIITTSGGGMLVSKNKAYVDRARWLSTQAKDDVPYYQHSVVGYNYRMSNVLAGIGRGQLEVLDDRVNRRREIYFNYCRELSEFDCFEWIEESENTRANHWLSVVLVREDSPLTAEQLIGHLGARGVEARRVWNPLHRNPLFSGCEFESAGSISTSDDLFERGVCLPSSSSLTEFQQERVIHDICELVRATV